jgi:hypothetical protein
MENSGILRLYGQRYVKTLFRTFGEFIRAQILVGVTLSGLILWAQIHRGLISASKVPDNVWAVLVFDTPTATTNLFNLV